MICASLNRFRFMLSPPLSLYQKTHARSGPFYEGKVIVAPNVNLSHWKQEFAPWGRQGRAGGMYFEAPNERFYKKPISAQ